MSAIEAPCFSTPDAARLRIEQLPFEKIPHQTRLFLDYLRDPVSLRRFYPTAVRSHHELHERVPEVLEAYSVDRQLLCDALESSNVSWGAGDATRRNITLLRGPDCVAVVSGQQAGLFTGPLFTIYKALTAVKLAGCLADRGTKAVPVFWIATEDHDFAEVATAEFIGCDCRLARVGVDHAMHRAALPVGRVVLDQSVDRTIMDLFEKLPETEFIPELESQLRDAWQAGRGYGEAFARMLSGLMREYGLVLLDPLSSALKSLAAPLYSSAARRAPQIAAAVEARSHDLVAEGYHAQVVANANSFPLFLHTEDGARHALTRNAAGRYAVKDLSDDHSADDLAELAIGAADRFSPNVTLRSVVQDYLLPTIAYVGGAAEIAYFAQTDEVYRILERPVTPILPRASMTLVSSRVGRTLSRYGLALEDFFGGFESLIARVVEKHLGRETAQVFNETESNIAHELDRLQAELRLVDPTLAAALATGRRKINYQLEGLRTRFHRAQLARDRAAHRQLERADAALYPEKTLQERRLNISGLLARHGQYVISWIYDAINLSSSDHQIVYL